jgi:hypothetical protein
MQRRMAPKPRRRSQEEEGSRKGAETQRGPSHADAATQDKKAYAQARTERRHSGSKAHTAPHRRGPNCPGRDLRHGHLNCRQRNSVLYPRTPRRLLPT